MEKERHVLVIFPHPDDEAFGVSGTIASHISNGTPVTYACLTLGEMGRNMGNPPFCNRETLPQIRKQELQNAAQTLGITDLRMLGYRDKTVEFEDQEKLITDFSSIIAEVNPSLIISFYPGYSVHPDHDATGAAVVETVKRMPKEKRPKLNLVAFSKNCVEKLGEPDIIHDVHPFISTKLATIKAHRSQTQLMVADAEEKLKQNDPQIIAWLQNERFWSYNID
ncbi:bacillithiol biosynthesis deacetylase BshB2 [Robertmurraya sp. DFI.2.37]|jgi:bacillithiol biosynthesis deacetylase BshB2|uniref:bacillithiol biosynthesis deacetylase BshB2 n=1 Tax=Robertmurraya sp. DFI.2.37 TaxID=3031819 RepID=UPI0012462260|nr:bacillithiol biosynthesis deacetylase BshB2 [Robertmurraya sp. DFI.2.37]MDF1507238.1 bacillithiol biosynthesis deacetylase BshB2 [Robertmurraya sp. DFI.2.37]